MQPEPAMTEAVEPILVSEPSTILQDALEEFEKSREALDQDEFRKWEEAWSVLANQFVGHENL